MLIINTTAEHEYIPVSERGEEKPFTVTIRRLGIRELAKMEDGYITIKDEDGAIALQQGSYNSKALKAGIVSWKNLVDDKGVEYSVKKSGKGEVLDESLNLLPPSLLTELANLIVSISKYPEDIDVLLGKDSKDK